MNEQQNSSDDFRKSIDNTFNEFFSMNLDREAMDQPSGEKQIKASDLPKPEAATQYETVVVTDFDTELGYVTESVMVKKAEQVFMVSQNDNFIIVDGITFIVNVNDHSNNVTLEISGGYAQDGDDDWYEIDDNETIRTLFEDAMFIEYHDQEFQVIITHDDLEKAKAYRKAYPTEMPLDNE